MLGGIIEHTGSSVLVLALPRDTAQLYSRLRRHEMCKEQRQKCSVEFTVHVCFSVQTAEMNHRGFGRERYGEF